MIDDKIEEMNEKAEKEFFEVTDGHLLLSTFTDSVEWGLFDVQLDDIYQDYKKYMIAGLESEEEAELVFDDRCVPALMKYWKDQFENYMEGRYA